MTEEEKILLAELASRLEIATNELQEFKQLYVTQMEFAPVKRSVNAAIGLLLTGTITYIMYATVSLEKAVAIFK